MVGALCGRGPHAIHSHGGGVGETTPQKKGGNASPLAVRGKWVPRYSRRHEDRRLGNGRGRADHRDEAGVAMVRPTSPVPKTAIFMAPTVPRNPLASNG